MKSSYHTIACDRNLPVIDFREVQERIAVTAVKVFESKLSLFSIMRDEMYFLPAFLEHYRILGVERFLILDDGSTDGTREFLSAQADCIVMTAPWGFGEKLVVRMPDGKIVNERAGTLLKRAIPTRFLMGQYAVYADADEFLVLPARFRSLQSLAAELQRHNISAVASSLIDFFPQDVSTLSDSSHPDTFMDHLKISGWFDSSPLVQLRPHRQLAAARPSASTRLFRAHGIVEPLPCTDWLPGWLRRAIPGRTPRAAWYKTPIIHWSDKTWMVGSHVANVPPTPVLLLAMVHFKFTPDFRRRVEAARNRKAHARKSQKYDAYASLLAKMEACSGTFVGPSSRQYSGPQEFESCGLIFDRL
jgi:Glycosyl transferase family 2